MAAANAPPARPSAHPPAHRPPRPGRSNASLVAHLARAAVAFLRLPANADASVLDVSQNDGAQWACRDPAELAVAAAEGSPMGPLLRAVNAVADAVKAAFPGRDGRGSGGVILTRLLVASL